MNGIVSPRFGVLPRRPGEGKKCFVRSCSLFYLAPYGCQSLRAKSNAPQTCQRNPKRVGSSTAKSSHPSEAEASPWTDAEVAAAKAKCTATLSGVRLDLSHYHQFNTAYGDTRAILVKSFEVEEKKVELDPPATVSCDLAKALSEWIDAVQREAKQLLGSTVVKLRASSYACRNIYNRAHPPLSQHALANALDVGEFVLSSGEHITVQEDWHNRSAVSQSPVRLASTATSLPKGMPATQEKSEFVVKAHEKACSIFGTVLGPRANKAHKDHFHLDMKQRDRSLCR